MSTIQSLLAPTRCLFASMRPSLRPFANHAQSSVSRQPLTAAFSTSPPLYARNKRGPKKDQRISIIRYHLSHPLTPRPLRFSRLRALRHWTIHRAWQLFLAKRRQHTELTLEKQYNAMRAACEALRLTGEDGLSIPEPGNVEPPAGLRDPKIRDGMDIESAAQAQKQVGKLYRIAMMKGGVWDGVPIEYARAQTETPARAGWDHGWTR